jgi:hypothetical protein
MSAFMPGDKYEDAVGVVWTVCYEGVSVCGHDSVAFSAVIDGRGWGMTLDRPDAYQRVAKGWLRKFGQMDLFSNHRTPAAETFQPLEPAPAQVSNDWKPDADLFPTIGTEAT